MVHTPDPVKPGYYSYPEAREGPQTSFERKLGANPVLRGLPLATCGSIIASVKFLQGFLWSNAGFDCLRKLDLNGYEARYDPCVIPIAENVAIIRKHNTTDFSRLYRNGPRYKNRHYSVADYHSAYEAGELTPTAVAKALLTLSKSPKHSAAFLSIDSKRVLAAAEASAARYRNGKPLGVFDGVPVSVKDEVDLEGYTRCLGSCQNFPSLGITSWCVRMWEDAGAVVVGKLNMHELGMDITNNNPTRGTPLNPHNRHYYCGGSSGGSAYATAAGLFPVTLGADGGGSIRVPSSYCGLYGLKPSHGRISGSPTPSIDTSCGVLGPIASNMADLEFAYRIMATPDTSNTKSSLFPAPTIPTTYQNATKFIGIYTAHFDVAEPSVLNACHAALSHFRACGYEIVDITLPYLNEGQAAHAMTILSEISNEIHDLGGLNAANKILVSVGKQTLASDFLLAQKLRNLLMQHLAWLFKQYPGLLIAMPTTPTAGYHISGGAADLIYGVSDANMSLRTMTYVWLANFLGCPALSIPVGMADPKEGDGQIPIGLMAMAEWGGEEQLFEWGRIGEEWAWREGEEKKMRKPENWVDVMKLARDF